MRKLFLTILAGIVALTGCNAQTTKTNEQMVNDKMVNMFELVQKRTPYRTPEGFFEQQERTLKKAIRNQQQVVRPLRRKWWYAAAASALLLIAVYPVIQLVKSSSDQTLTSISDSTPIYSQTSSVSDDWSDFADADIFMDNMNW